MLQAVQYAVIGQYLAGLQMLGQCIERADPVLWRAPVGKFPFWHVAYHVLFFVDLYSSRNESAFRPQAFHVEDAQFLGQQPWPPFKKVVLERVYEKEQLLAYLPLIEEKVKRAMESETEQTLAGESGFDWIPLTRLELHLYNIRHLQHHTGQLGAALRRSDGQGVMWVGSGNL